MEMLGAPIKAFIRDHCKVGPTDEAGVDDLYSNTSLGAGKKVSSHGASRGSVGT